MITDNIRISLCCGSDVEEGVDPKIEEGAIFNVCGRCQRACEVREVCALCRGTGEVDVDETDEDGNVAHGVDTRKCICQINQD